MKRIYRGCGARAASLGRAAVLQLVATTAAVFPTPAFGTITAVGEVSPTYPGGLDPWNVAAELFVGAHADGSLTIDGDSDVTSEGGSLGTDPGFTGTIVVSGDGSTWTNNADLILGNLGTGRLNVLQGAHVEDQGASLGHLDGTGEALVEGIGSRWTNLGNLFAGNLGDGTLTIRQQGVVRTSSAWIGLNVDAIGAVTVDGENSRWEISETLSLGDEVDGGAGTLSLSGAGSRVYVGSGASSFGGQLPIDQTALIVSATTGVAQLAIYDGNQLENAGNGYVSPDAGTSGNVIVAGAGSAWNNGGDVLVGVDGTATLTLISGGAVSAGGSLTVGSLGTLLGNGAVSGETLNSGTVAPGQSVGSLAVVGEYSQAMGGTLQIELGGSMSGEYDTLGVTGDANLDGTLEVLLDSEGGNPFDPQLGHTFDFLSASATIVGEFSAADLPMLAAGRMWQIRYSTNQVTLAVTLAGDYNDNGIVDAADFTVWRDLLGATFDPRADGDTNGMVDSADYDVWKASFGLAAGGGSGAGAAASGIGPAATRLASVPEPSFASILLIGTSLLLVVRSFHYNHGRRIGERIVAG
jgi:T5SS/PEP-CTERM-associated repeat protein